MGVLVLARPAEALAVKDEAGLQADTTEEGYELKDEQLRKALTTYGLNGNMTFFFNSLEDDPEGMHPAPSSISAHVHDTLLEEIRRVHASSVNAAVRREGEWRSMSYTHQLGRGARKRAMAALHNSVTGFADLCGTWAGIRIPRPCPVQQPHMVPGSQATWSRRASRGCSRT
jgi:hypothetical protein